MPVGAFELRQNTSTSSLDPGTFNSPGKSQCVARPTVGLDEPIEKWEDFSSSWQQYKEEYCLSGKKLTRQLVACCSPDLATSLSRVSGGKHFDLEETDILKQMKNLVVRFENPAVHVQTFLAMHQQPEEGVRHFLARLRGVANHCEFKFKIVHLPGKDNPAPDFMSVILGYSYDNAQSTKCSESEKLENSDGVNPPMTIPVFFIDGKIESLLSRSFVYLTLSRTTYNLKVYMHENI